MTRNVRKFCEKVVEIASSSEFTLYIFVNISRMKTPRVTFDPSKSSQGTTALKYNITLLYVGCLGHLFWQSSPIPPNFDILERNIAFEHFRFIRLLLLVSQCNFWY
jgi:hypothetical protein